MPRSPLVPMLRVGCALACVAVLLFQSKRKTPPQVITVPADAPVFFTVDMRHDAGAAAVDIPVPGAPFRGQKTDCRPGVHTAINGGCWRKLADTPPCEEAYLWRGGCYLPVMMAERPVTSIHP